ncbi:hypothetical protein MYX07_02260 [Patescibacteria group bacterium AH-259-L07]|nr:hypothetical protein [Patescibacteria group bacterium AH-259-L07]
MIQSILISGLKIFIILIVIIGIYILFAQIPISYISDHIYFSIYAHEQLMQHYWFNNVTEMYQYSNSMGLFHIKEKTLFLIKKLYARFFKKNLVGYGYIDFSQVVKLLQDETKSDDIFGNNQSLDSLPIRSEQVRSLEMTSPLVIPVNIYLAHDPSYIFFTLDISDMEYSMTQSRGVNNSVLYNSTPDRIFILGFSSDKSLEDFEKKIKAHLALHTPVEKRVVLPDGSTFIEIIADIDVFDFKDKVIDEKRVRYWEDDNKRVVLWKDKNYIFVSNSLEANQNFISMCFSNLEDNKFRQAVYVQLNTYNIEDIIMGEGDKKLEGCLKLVTQQDVFK